MWRNSARNVSSVRSTNIILIRPVCIPGRHLRVLGKGFISTLQGLIWEKCSCCWMILSANGWKCLLFRLLVLLKLLRSLRICFSMHRIPDIIFSDNGSAFTSEELMGFASKNDIKLITSTPYHPSSNGAAEHTLQTFKTFIEKQDKSESSLQALISQFLFSYRNTPHSRAGL